MYNADEIKSKALEALGFKAFNEMQVKMLGAAASGRNSLLLSPTGSGKTVAFLMPLLVQLSASDQLRAAVIVPSRELAQQIADVWRQMKTGMHCVCCYGGHDARIELRQLNAGFRLLVSTPGRMKDHVERTHIDASVITHLVLDEYDKSLELGFEEEMRFLVGRMPNIVQRILTSATHGTPIAPWTGFSNYEKLDFLNASTANESQQKYEQVSTLSIRQVKSPIADKLETLRDLLCSLPADAQAIVFSGYRESSERISHYLSEQGIGNALYHGGLDQDLRDKAMARLRGGSIRVLVSTDLASRGLDIPDVSHIIHYHLPADEETFTHRNGRTARAGASGTAYLIVGPNEYLPAFISEQTKFFNLRPNPQGFEQPEWVTVYIGRGKREKISRGDILGFFTKNGGIDGACIGRIDIMEHSAYCAVRRDVVDQLLAKVKGLKIKGEKTHYLVVS